MPRFLNTEHEFEAADLLGRLRERLGGWSVKKWQAEKDSLIREFATNDLIQAVFDYADKDTITDTRIRVVCKRILRARDSEAQQQLEANPLYGSF